MVHDYCTTTIVNVEIYKNHGILRELSNFYGTKTFS